MTFVTLPPQHPHWYTPFQIIGHDSGLRTRGKNTNKSNTRIAQFLNNVRMAKGESMTAIHVGSWSQSKDFAIGTQQRNT